MCVAPKRQFVHFGSFEAKNVHGQCVRKPERGGDANRAPHLFTRWSSLCQSPLSPCILSGGLCAEHKDVRCVPQLRVRIYELLNYSSQLPPRASVISQAEFSVCLESKAPFPYLYFPSPVLPVSSHGGLGTHNAPFSGWGRLGDGVAATGSPCPCPQGAADSPSHYPRYGWQHHWSGQENEKGN